MSSESISGIKCKCGGRLRRSLTDVEFFGIDFGMMKTNVCTRCGAEYLEQEVMEEVEKVLKRRGFSVSKEGGRWPSRGTLWLSASLRI